MTELVIVSGKGGTGKTSIVGSLATLAKNAVLVDCDVDAADLHLIVQHERKESSDFVSGKRASIDMDKCVGCGICVEYCRFDAVKHEPDESAYAGERYWIDKYACDGCGVCHRFCPTEAIDFKDVKSGEWFVSETPHGPLLHAQLGIAQSNSGKLVALLRKESKSVATQRGIDLVIVDGPPGIGCPVIAAITGAGFLLFVTEPSLSALHDMERLMQLAEHFNIRSGICINKFDINLELSGKIEDFANEHGVKVFGRIPFDPSFTKAQLAGTSLANYSNSDTSKQIEVMWDDLRQSLQMTENRKMELGA